MDVALDPLESLWPPYRGSVLLGAAQESQGRICNAGVAVTAGHVAISLDVHPDCSPAPAPAPAAPTAAPTASSHSGDEGSRQRGDDEPVPSVAAADVDGAASPPSLRLTVLLDAVPASAPKPGTQQLARFLTKVLGRSAVGVVQHGDGRGGSGIARRKGGSLGADVPELLVVEHMDEVVCSEFLSFDCRRADSGTRTAEGASGGGTSRRRDSSNRSGGLAYACIEASGLLRLWEWRGTESGRWTWSYLDSCNICACREEPVGCRVLTAAIVPEPCDDGEGKGSSSSSNRRHRLVWEQEDSGEGAGLGLASTPAAGPRPPRRVWSRRVALDLSEGGVTVDRGFGFANQQQQQQQQQQQHPSMESNGGVRFGGGGGGATGCAGSARSEISLAFSACLLPTRVDALLCSRLGAWMPAGQRVYFNHFATGRLPCVTLPSLLLPQERGGTGWVDEPAAAESTADGSFGPDAYDGAAAGTGDGATFPDESDLEVEGALGAGNEDSPAAAAAATEQTAAFGTESTGGRGGSPSQGSARRLFSVHDSTGDLMVYDHQPRATVRVLSLPSGAGGLRVRLQCTLDPPPPSPPASPPGSFAARSNIAVFCGGGLCSVYDLCTGRLIGSAAIPRCPACALRRRHRSKKAAGVAKPCTCGRRQQQGSVASEPLDGGRAAAAAASAGPELWTSATRGLLLGILTATQVLRARIPRAEACLTATLAPSLCGGTPPPPSAPSALRYLREYRRLVAGTTAGAWPSSPLPELLRTAHQGRAGAISAEEGRESARAGASMMGLIAHALSAEERGFLGAGAAARGGLDAANGSGGRKETSVPPWLLMAIVSASQNQGPVGAPEVGGMGAPPSFGGGGDPTMAATEVGLRDALERRVEESLRSLNNVRALLQDPAGSARHSAADGAGSALRAGGADDEAAGRLAALTAGVDPATALFEGTLREWLACRRRGRGDGELYGQRPREGSRWGGGMRGSGLGRCEGGLRPVGDDALALAFRCEAAGDAEAMEIPFLHFLLEVSGEADPGRDEKPGDRRVPLGKASSSSASSTLLCLQLAGDDASPLFEIACRALFRLRPQKLPRFVERLARFRAYANEIKREGRAGAVGAGATPPQDSGGDEERREGKEEEEGEVEETHPASLQSGRQGASVSSSADARSERTSAGDTAFSEEQQQQQQQQKQKQQKQKQQRRSPSPPPQSGIASRRTSEDNASEHGGRDSRSTTRPSSTVTSREHSPEPPAAPPAPAPAPPPPAAAEPPPSGAADDLPEPATGPPSAALEHPEGSSRESAPVAPAYFARALASLPPAVEDDRAAGAGSQQRRARLSLLLGACRFAEACKLLRSRAWECAGSSPGGKRGSWRGDRGGEEAWRAAMRLLNELRRAVAVTGKGGEDAAAASGAEATAAASGGDDDAAVTVGAAGVPLPLQFRLAFEDALAETILADSPERMEAVMLCRPEGLTPVAVVRMVRRASRAAAETSAAAGTGGGGGGGNKVEETRRQFLSGSTQTLKMCLLLLLEELA